MYREGVLDYVSGACVSMNGRKRVDGGIIWEGGVSDCVVCEWVVRGRSSVGRAFDCSVKILCISILGNRLVTSSILVVRIFCSCCHCAAHFPLHAPLLGCSFCHLSVHCAHPAALPFTYGRVPDPAYVMPSISRKYLDMLV